MSWEEYHRRRAAIAAVIRHAQHHPHTGLPYDSLPEVKAVFTSRTELLRALQYDWSVSLWTQIETVSLETNSRLADAADVCRQAWHATTQHKPILRRLLDDHQDELENSQALVRSRQLPVSTGIGHTVQGRLIWPQVA